MMFGRFTERAQKVLALSQEEAVRLGIIILEQNIFFLGLFVKEKELLLKHYNALGLESRKIQEEVEKLIGTWNSKPMQTIHYTPRAKKVLSFQWMKHESLGHSYVGTEHILLGFIREGEGVAARVLNNLRG